MSTQAGVAALTGSCGETVSNRNRLADIDLLVANPEQEVILLLEVEGKISSPKKLLGDVFAVLMCNWIAIKQVNQQTYFTISPTARLLIAGSRLSRGRRWHNLSRLLRHACINSGHHPMRSRRKMLPSCSEMIFPRRSRRSSCTSLPSWSRRVKTVAPEA